MEYALYLNGAPEVALREIVRTQHLEPDRVCYIQPHGEQDIKKLADVPPTIDSPIHIYISTTTKLDSISYVGLIVGWQRKAELTRSEKANLDIHIERFQPSEGSIYLDYKGKIPANLISISALRKLREPYSVTTLRKTSDGKKLGIRSQSGRYSYVELLVMQAEAAPVVEKTDLQSLVAEFDEAVENSLNGSPRDRAARLARADKLPTKVVMHSEAYRRNPDVVAEVLARANGTCEECYRTAPFRRRRDGTAYLEVHHREMLSLGGEDTVDNAMAVCPNCHRKLHFG